MKRLIVIALIFSGACQHDDPAPSKRCLSGILKSDPGGSRFTIRCCTEKEYLAGSNVSAGGTASWENYTQIKWETCEDCN